MSDLKTSAEELDKLGFKLEFEKSQTYILPLDPPVDGWVGERGDTWITITLANTDHTPVFHCKQEGYPGVDLKDNYIEIPMVSIDSINELRTAIEQLRAIFLTTDHDQSQEHHPAERS